MNGWIKHYSDGSKYLGLDNNTKRSWRLSRNTDIESVELCHNGHVCVIEGLGEYWQSDSLKCTYPATMSVYRARRLQRLISNKDHFIELNKNDRFLHLKVRQDVPSAFSTNPNLIWVKGYMHDQWLTIELDLEQGNSRYYFMDKKI